VTRRVLIVGGRTEREREREREREYERPTKLAEFVRVCVLGAHCGWSLLPYLDTTGAYGRIPSLVTPCPLVPSCSTLPPPPAHSVSLIHSLTLPSPSSSIPFDRIGDSPRCSALSHFSHRACSFFLSLSRDATSAAYFVAVAYTHRRFHSVAQLLSAGCRRALRRGLRTYDRPFRSIGSLDEFITATLREIDAVAIAPSCRSFDLHLHNVDIRCAFALLTRFLIGL
jgi:hypothetical protein